MTLFSHLINWDTPKLHNPKSLLSNWALVFTLTFLSMQPVMNMLMTTILSTEVQGYFAIDGAKAIWIGRTFLFMITISPLFSIHFALVQGFKKSLFLGLALFYFGIISSSFAPNFFFMIATRAVAGLGAGMILSINLAYAGRYVNEKIRRRALAIYGNGFFGLGIAAGLLVGGYIGAFYHWKWSFYFSFFLAIPSFLLFLLFIAETSKTDKPPFDYLGFFSLVISVFALLLLVSEVKEPWNTMGLDALFIKICWVVSLLCFILFATSSYFKKHPLIPFSLFTHLRFCLGALGLIIVGLMIFGVTLIQMSLLETVYLYDRWTIGWFVSQVGFIYLLFGIIPMILINRVPLRIFILLGLTLILLSCFFMEKTTIQSDMWQIGKIQAIHSIGVAILLGPLPVYALSILPPDEVGKGASFLTFLRFAAASFGSAVIGLISAVRLEYHSLRFGEQVQVNSSRYQQYFSELSTHVLRNSGSTPSAGKEQSRQLIIEYIINQAKIAAFNDAVYLLGWLATLFFIVISTLMIRHMVRKRSWALLLEKIPD